MDECVLCHRDVELVKAGFCDFCLPETCLNCHASHVYWDSPHWKCSHGCEYEISEYMTRKLFTVILNGTPQEKLAFAGKRIEYIIPEGTDVLVHESTPQRDTREGHIFATHYTEDKESILSEGLNYPETTKERWEGTVRENAAYAWPYNRSYLESETDDFDWGKPSVVFELPRDSIRVSSYRFLYWIGKAEDETERKFEIPKEKYEESLTFTVDQLIEAIKEFDRPRPFNQLFLG